MFQLIGGAMFLQYILNIKKIMLVSVITSLLLISCGTPATPLPPPTPTVIPPTVGPVPTEPSRINNYTDLYSGPSDVFDILSSLDPGAALQVLGIDPTGDWAKVKVIDASSSSSKTGWVKLQDVTFNADIQSYPVDYNIPPTPIPPAACFTSCASIVISNDTGGPLSVSVAGFSDGKWSVVVGTQTIDLKPGSYTITATALCGTKTDVVVLTEGMIESYSYYCQTIP